MSRLVRNIAIIAHVDHGKTTLVDKLLQQAGTFAAHQHVAERVMDSNDLEKERGITILAKNLAVDYQGVHINIVDTPGHADFGGEVERVLGMVDGVLLLVDAVEGPMPQTRFVTRKALALGLKPIVVVNKIDRAGSRPDWVVDHTFDLFDKLGATDEQLDFPVIYASALNGYATTDLKTPGTDMRPMFEAILSHVPAPEADDIDGPLQLQIAALDYSSYVGRIGIGRIQRGKLKPAQQITVMYGQPDADGNFEHGAPKNAKVNQVFGFKGIERTALDEAVAGDIVLVTGIEELSIGCTITDPNAPEALPMLKIDEPTLNMTFMVNNSPYAGTEGKFVTSRQIRERLNKELLTNMALRVEETSETDSFLVSGRGELHLTILLETMRREGFELALGRPEVIIREVDGVKQEPFENVTIDIPEEAQGKVMEEMGLRKGDLSNMVPDGKGRVRLEYNIPARGLIGFRNQFLTLTNGAGILTSIFDRYDTVKSGHMSGRQNGVLVSVETGKALTYSLETLQARGKLFVEHGQEIYTGQIVGQNSRDNDLGINPTKGKKLDNMRASGKDETIALVPPVKFTLEQALEYIQEDELCEVTPKSIRLRKKILDESERTRAAKKAKI